MDLEIHARIQTKDHGNKSLHWTHQYAELSRIDNPGDTKNAQRKLEDVQLIELLPSLEVLNSLKRTWTILVSRVLYKYISAFRNFKDVIIYHIPHQHSEEMAKKSYMVNNKLWTFFLINELTAAAGNRLLQKSILTVEFKKCLQCTCIYVNK